MRTLKYLLLVMLLFSGCGQESKVFEKGGKTYYEDSSGELYLLEGNKKIKVEDYVEPPKKKEPPKKVKPKFVDTKSFTRTWDKAPNKFKVNLKLRHLNDGVMWEATIQDVEGKALHKTQYGRLAGIRHRLCASRLNV